MSIIFNHLKPLQQNVEAFYPPVQCYQMPEPEDVLLGRQSDLS
jgi:hypothetical protein